MSENRIQGSYFARVSAADAARSRTYPHHQANGDEQKLAGAKFAMSFTKGLEHDLTTGLIKDPSHFMAFREAIDAGEIDAFNNRVPVPSFDVTKKEKRRKWEAPTAGLAYDLQGPDCQSVTMAPAPPLCSDELTFEMAEVYELALLRDVPFQYWDKNGGDPGSQLGDSLDRMNSYPYAVSSFGNRPRKTDDTGALTHQTMFRGSSPGVETGPYLSQFLLIGNAELGGGHGVEKGLINYGTLELSQKVKEASPVDFMTDWTEWLAVQNGLDVNDTEAFPTLPNGAGQEFTGARRFIHTPRDLATYVHFDALYEAYLNACLILLGMGTPFDPGFASLSGMRSSYPPSGAVPANAGGFALYGGPHILTLVTEVATRALKAARFQKFNTHIRARPEVLAARIFKRHEIESAHPQLCGCLSQMHDDISLTVSAIEAKNSGNSNALLPMAFREGSPMHPSYAAGHATVAGACVTVLKAFFDTGTAFYDNADGGVFKHGEAGDDPIGYLSKVNGTQLDKEAQDCPLTLEGELNKLAANISIGRNMAGVHYFSDYYDSLRMGEEIAIGMLEEQALCYPTDPFVMSLPTFDGETIRIGAR